MGFEKVYNNYAREASLVDGAMFLKASLHGGKRKRGSWGGGAQPPHLQTRHLYHAFSEGPYMASGFAGRMILEVATEPMN